MFRSRINKGVHETTLGMYPTSKMCSKTAKKWRLVSGCRKVNKHIVCEKFSPEGIESVSEQIREGKRLISIDLRNGSHHIPVHKDFWQLLGIEWQ